MLDHEHRAGWLWAAATAAALALAIAFAAIADPATAPARGGCGQQVQEKPRKNVAAGRAPLAIGDSPMLLALRDLAKIGYRANARGCRTYEEGVKLMRKLRKADKLPKLVVVALGSNGTITKGNIHKALRQVGRKGILGLVTPRETGGRSGHDARLVRSEAKKHAKRTVLLDWVRFSKGHPGWFQPDGLHLTYSGAAAMARLFKRALKVLPPPKR